MRELLDSGNPDEWESAGSRAVARLTSVVMVAVARVDGLGVGDCLSPDIARSVLDLR